MKQTQDVRTLQMDDVPYTVYSPQTNQLLDLYTDTNHRQPAAPSINNHAVDACTDTNQPQLLHPCTTHRGPLEYAVGSHLECSACRIRDSPLPHFPNRCHSSHLPTVAIKPSSRRLHGHQSASALTPMHHTSWTAGIRARGVVAHRNVLNPTSYLQA